MGTNSAVLLVNTGKVDLGDEVDDGRLIRVGVSTVDFQAIDTVLVAALQMSE